MGKLFYEDEYGARFIEAIENPPIVLIDDINKTVRFREGFMGDFPFYSAKKHYDWVNNESEENQTSQKRS